MAKQTGINTFTGKLGNLIGYRRNGQYFLRTMPETVRQTAATGHAARDFGLASRKGKLIRQAIVPLLNIPCDGSLVNRLNKALISAGKDQLQTINGFRFNRHTGVEQFFSLQPLISPGGTVTIPAQTLPSQGTATYMEVKLVAVRISFAEHLVTGQATAVVMINLNTHFPGMELDAAIPGKGTLLVVLQARSFHEQQASANRCFVAANILGVVVPAKTKQRVKAMPDLKRVLSYKKKAVKKCPVTSGIPYTVATQQRE
ncbi:hypothetical protein [Chitinophaga polysaccharea]|uniref:hypothetical protein n=1 Tax=Chitinophaga polysaccharea TaxID=1293035 RepID=UPI0011589C4D|nr:hypothetical protein [Chitinophaga polysaccharea]